MYKRQIFGSSLRFSPCLLLNRHLQYLGAHYVFSIRFDSKKKKVLPYPLLVSPFVATLYFLEKRSFHRYYLVYSVSPHYILLFFLISKRAGGYYNHIKFVTKIIIKVCLFCTRILPPIGLLFILTFLGVRVWCRFLVFVPDPRNTLMFFVFVFAGLAVPGSDLRNHRRP